MNNNLKREINFFSRWRVTRYPKATFTPLELGKYTDCTKPVFCPFRNHWLNFWIVVRVFRAQLGLICVRQIQVWPYLSVDEQWEFLDRMDFDAIFQQINLHINEQYEFIHQKYNFMLTFKQYFPWYQFFKQALCWCESFTS